MTRKTTQAKTADSNPPETTIELPENPTDEKEPQLGSDVEQFPAKHGEPETEVAHRSVDGSEGMRHRKVFVLLGQFGEDHPVHEQNKARVHEEAIQRGLHPKGHAELVDMTEVPEVRGRVSTELTYEVEVLPASVDPEAAKTVTAHNVTAEKD